jgi:acyl-CoA thioester hydrolase
MEDGRESFGAAHGISYLDIQAAGYSTPVVSIRCNYKRALKYGEKILIETSYIDSPAAKIIFHYKIYRENFQELVAEGESVQVFLDSEGQLCLVNPVFIEAWKLKWLGGGNVHG